MMPNSCMVKISARAGSTFHAFFLFAQAVGEVGQKLFLAGDDIAQFVNARLQPRVVDALDEFLVAHDQQQRALRGDIGDQQRGEMIGALGTVIFQRAEDLVLALPELFKADLLDLRDAELDAVFGVFLAVGGDGLRRGLEREQRAGSEQFFRELRALTEAMPSSFFKISMSREVVVGEVRFSVSVTTPASSRPAMGRGSSTPCRKKQSATIVHVEPTGSLRNKIGCCVAIEPSRW